MSITAEISSSLPFANGAYFQAGLGDIPITVKVYNSGSSPVQINQIILSQQNLPVPTLVGEIGIIRNNIVNTANNTVPPAVTTTVTGTIPLPSGSGNSTVWFVLPLHNTYSVPPPPATPIFDGLLENIGFYGLQYFPPPEPPFMLPIPATNTLGANGSGIVIGPPSPVMSGAVQLSASLNIATGSQNPTVDGLLNNFGSSSAPNFTYEWWSYLRSYGIPYTGATASTDAGLVWSVGSFDDNTGPLIIGYTTEGRIYALMEEDILAPYPHPPEAGLSSSAIVPLNQWVHQAVTRVGGQLTFWIDGTGSGGGSRPNNTNPHGFNNFNLFAPALGIPSFTPPYEGLIESVCDGYFMEMRMSNYARYTSNFTPPTASFPATYGFGGGNAEVSSSTTVVGSASYSALISPQTDAIYYFPSANNGGAYNFNLQGTVQIGKGANFITASQADFTIFLSQLQTPSINSPYRVWSLFDDRAPPFLTGSDFIIQGQILTAETPNQYVLTFPPDFVYFSSSDNSIATVIENGIGTYVTGSTGNPQLSGSGGSVKIMGQTGSVIISMAVGDPNSPPAAELELTVIDAYPLTVSTFPQQAYGKIGADLQLRAYLSKTNGSNTDITNDPLTTWSVEPSNFATITNGLLSISSPAVGEASPAGQVLTVSAVYNNSFRELLGISQVIVRN